MSTTAANPPALEGAPAGVTEAYHRLSGRKKALALILAGSPSNEQACRDAGYAESTVLSKASSIAADPDVRTVANWIATVVIQASIDSLDGHVKELLALGHFDVGDAFGEDNALLPIKQMPAHVRRSIQAIESREVMGTVTELDKDGVPVEKLGVVGYVRKIKFQPKLTALDQLAKVRAYYKPELHDHRHRVVGLADILEEIDGSDTGTGPATSRR